MMRVIDDAVAPMNNLVTLAKLDAVKLAVSTWALSVANNPEIVRLLPFNNEEDSDEPMEPPRTDSTPPDKTTLPVIVPPAKLVPVVT